MTAMAPAARGMSALRPREGCILVVEALYSFFQITNYHFRSEASDELAWQNLRIQFVRDLKASSRRVKID